MKVKFIYIANYEYVDSKERSELYVADTANGNSIKLSSGPFGILRIARAHLITNIHPVLELSQITHELLRNN